MPRVDVAATTVSAWSAIQADVFRIRGRSGVSDVAWCALNARNFRPILTLRLVQRVHAPGAGPLRRLASLPLRLLHRLFCWMASMDLSHETQIGPGLCITHGWGLVVSPGARIGANCTLFHGVTLGRKDDIDEHGGRHTGYPVIEDEVWIGPHAVIVGAVVVGRGARVAPGTITTKDVPAGCIVAGNPMRVLHEGAPPDVFNRAPTACPGTTAARPARP